MDIERQPIGTTEKAISHLKERKVLLVEDNDDVRTAFELILNHCGYDARAVSTGEEGLHAIKESTYDIIICDYRLPGIDGLEFYYWAQPYTPQSIKVLISAFGFDDIVVNAKALGVEQFYEKPFSIPAMLKRIERRADRKFFNLSVVGAKQ